MAERNSALPAIFVLGPVLAQEEMDGARTWAIITAAFGLGCVLSDLLLLRWRPRVALRVASLMLIGASCQAAFIGSGLSVWAIAGFEVLAGICVTGTFTLWETSLQEHVPDRALSRVSSYDYLTSAGLIPVGNLVVGMVSSTAGVRPSLFAMTALGVTASVLIATGGTVAARVLASVLPQILRPVRRHLASRRALLCADCDGRHCCLERSHRPDAANTSAQELVCPHRASLSRFRRPVSGGPER